MFTTSCKSIWNRNRAEFLPIVGNDNRIFSIEVLNGGSGYDETTGLVVVDNTGNGKGVARPLVKDGVITQVVLMKTGYGYCLNTTDDESVGIGTNVVGTIEDIFPEAPGFNYSPDDTVIIGDNGSNYHLSRWRSFRCQFLMILTLNIVVSH